MWSKNSLLEVAMKFGVSMVIPMNEARENPRNLASCLVLTCAFDAKRIIKKGTGLFKIFKVI